MRYFISLLVLTIAVSTSVAAPAAKSFERKLSDSAKERTDHIVIYNGAYRKISYPNGDVPKMYGVCTDVIIRSYRKLGIDLQKNVHEDMLAAFDQYPKLWGLKKPDANIDHRRVPNLQAYFERHGESIKVSKNPKNYQIGDIVTWILSGSLPHIGIVVDARSSDGKRPMIVHNIGWGPKMDDMLFDYPITGHYRYQGLKESDNE